MRIVISFVNAVWQAGKPEAMPCFYESFVEGLRDQGHDLLVFSSPNARMSASMEESLRHQIAGFSPDIVVAFNNFGPDYSAFCECPILVYEVDSILYYHGKDWVRRNPNRYLYCTSEHESRTILTGRFNVEDGRIAELPFFTSVRAEKREKRFNVSFVGSRFNGRRFHWHDFMQASPDLEKVSAYQRLMDEIRLDPFRVRAELIAKYPELDLDPRALDSLITSLSAEKRIQVLSAVAEFGLTIWGPPDQWLSGGGECADLYLAYDRTPVYSLRHNQDVYNASKVCLNVNHLQSVSGFSWRVCDIMASTGCLLSEYRPNLSSYFPNVDIPTFGNKHEAYAQCRRLLESDSLREDVSCACREAIDSGYRFVHLLRRLDAKWGLKLEDSAAARRGTVRFVGAECARGGGSERWDLACYAFKLMMSQLPPFRRLFKARKYICRIADYENRIET